MGLFDNLKNGLQKTRGVLNSPIEDIFSTRKIDDDTLEELEEALIAVAGFPSTGLFASAGEEIAI